MKEQDYSIEETATAMDSASLSETSGDGYEVSLIDVLTQLAYRKWLIAKVTGIAVLAGVIISLVLPVRYTATTKIMPPQQTQSAASMMMSQLTSAGGGSLAALAGGGLGLKNPNDIYVGLLTSRPIADAIIQKFGLMQVYHAKDMTTARKQLAGYTEVTSEKNGFIAISVTDKDKKRVAEMANAYTDQLRILTQTLAVTEASQRRLFYEEQLKQAKEALVAAELAFQQVQQQKGLVQLDAQAKAMIERHCRPSRAGRSQTGRDSGSALLFDRAKPRRAIGREGVDLSAGRGKPPGAEQSLAGNCRAGAWKCSCRWAGISSRCTRTGIPAGPVRHADEAIRCCEAGRGKRGGDHSGCGAGHRAGSEIVSKACHYLTTFRVCRLFLRLHLRVGLLVEGACPIDPMTAKQLEELSCALRGQKSASA